MADIELIIKIPEEVYSDIIDGHNITLQVGESLRVDDVWASDLIRNGTPLLKLIDLEGLKNDMKALNCGYPYGLDYLLDCLRKRLGIE